MTKYNAGWIHYTNAAPILDNLRLPFNVAAVTGVPSEMNEALLQGRVDIANISAAEFVHHADKLVALPDFCIGCLGRVYSVNLFHTKPLEELRRIAVTTQSSTSVALLNILLAQWGLSPEVQQAEGTAEELFKQGYDGVMRIGDDALAEWYAHFAPIGPDMSMTRLPSVSGGVHITDLSREWWYFFGLPFVFAVWAYRADRPPPPELLQAMRHSRRQGIGSLGAVAMRHAERLGVPQRVVQHYLWNFRYHLEESEKLGLARFASLLEPQHAPLRFGDHTEIAEMLPTFRQYSAKLNA